MTFAIQHTILIVDDEASIRSSLQRLLCKLQFPVLSASGCEEAMALLNNRKETVSLIISDQRMPGITGAEFLEKSRALFPDAIRFLLTGYSDLDAVIDAVNRGQIHRYLTKPWNNDELIWQVKESLKQYELVTENKRLLALNQKQTSQLFKFGIIMKKKVNEHSQSIGKLRTGLQMIEKELKESHADMVKTFALVTEGKIPLSMGHGDRVSLSVRELAVKLKIPAKDLYDLELAALAHDIGKISLPLEINYMVTEQLSGDSLEQYRKHPELGQALFSFTRRLEGVGKMIRHHHESFDGQGWPDGLRGKEIPMGARLLAVANTYDRMVKINDAMDAESVATNTEKTGKGEAGDGKNTPIKEAVFAYIADQSGKKFDPAVVDAFMELAGK